MLFKRYSPTRTNAMHPTKLLVPRNLKQLALRNSTSEIVLPSLVKSSKTMKELKIEEEGKIPIVDNDVKKEIPIFLSGPINVDIIVDSDLPSLKDCPSVTKKLLLFKKFDILEVPCLFNNETKDIELVKTKTRTLKEICDFINIDNKQYLLNFDIMNKFSRVCCLNLHRDFQIPKEQMMIPGDESIFINPGNQHFIYFLEILTKYITVFKGKSIITKDLLNLLIDLIGTPDIRERRVAAIFVTRYIVAFPDNVNLVLNKVFYNIYQYTLGNIEYFGIGTYLNIITTNYEKFTQLFPNNLAECVSYIIQVANSPHLRAYASPLLHFFFVAIEKTGKVSRLIITKLIQRFPLDSLINQAIFLNYINNLVLKTSIRTFSDFCVPLFRLYASCLTSESKKVVEESLNIWTEKQISRYVGACAKEIYPIIFKPLKMMSTCNANDAPLAKATSDILALMNKISPIEYVKAEDHFVLPDTIPWEGKWQIIKNTASTKKITMKK